MTDKDIIPTPPRRLFEDKRVLNQESPAAWESRRASKMRERFPQDNHQPLRGLSLVAPVQPSLPARRAVV